MNIKKILFSIFLLLVLSSSALAVVDFMGSDGEPVWHNDKTSIAIEEGSSATINFLATSTRANFDFDLLIVDTGNNVVFDHSKHYSTAYSLVAYEIPSNLGKGNYNVVVKVSDVDNAQSRVLFLTVEDSASSLYNFSIIKPDFNKTLPIFIDNEAPVWANIPNRHIPENHDLSITMDLNKYVFDPDGDELTFSLSQSNPDLISCSLFNSGFLNGWMMCDPPASNSVGQSTISITASDGFFQSTQTFTIFVESDNNPPVLYVDNVQVYAGETAVINAGATDDKTAFADLVFSVSDARFSQSHNVFEWSTTSADRGIHEVLVSVSDGQYSSAQIITVEVLNNPAVVDFNWTPEVPLVSQIVYFDGSATFDVDGDDLIFNWDFDGTFIVDAVGEKVEWTFDAPGIYPVTLSVYDGHEYSQIVKNVEVIHPVLNVTDLVCEPSVIEGHQQYCTVRVSSDVFPTVGEAEVNLYYDDGSHIGSCDTNNLSSACGLYFDVGPAGVYTVYATAEKDGFVEDFSGDLTYTFEVLTEIFDVSGLAVYNDSLYSQENYVFFRGEEMFVKFQVSHLGNGSLITGAERDNVVSKVTLVSPISGGTIELDKDAYLTDDAFYFRAVIPLTHDFFGDSNVFAFAFNIEYTAGGQQMSAPITILNNPPQILDSLDAEFSTAFNETTTINLVPHGFDLEDASELLSWSFVNSDNSVVVFSIDANNTLTLNPINDGVSTLTLSVEDLNGDFDTRDFLVFVEGLDGNDSNIPPVVVLDVDPLQGVAPLLVTANACNSFDPDGFIVGTTLMMGDLVFDACEASVTFVSAGNYTITAIVVDNSGAVSTLSQVVEVLGSVFDNDSSDWWKVPVNPVKDNLEMRRVDIGDNGVVYAGNQMLVSTHLVNGFSHKLEDVSVTVFVDGFDVSKSRRATLASGKGASFVTLLDVPASMEPGVYSIRIVANSGEVTRVKLREFIVK